MSKPTIAIYGATAFCAGPIIELLIAHRDRSLFNLLLAGRNADKLSALSSEFGGLPFLAASTTDESSVDKLVRSCELIINCAGPFRRNGAEALIRACAEQGKHYLDLCGEREWLGREIIPKYHEVAAKTGACIVPTCGVDSVPSDMMVYLASKALQQEYPEATVRSSLSMWSIKGALPGGTVQSMVDLGEYADIISQEKKRGQPSKTRQHGSGEWIMTPLRGPTGGLKLSQQFEHPHPSVRQRTGAFWFMYPLNRCVVRRSWYLARKVLPDATPGNPEPKMGPELVYQEALDVRMGRFGSSLLTLAIVSFFVIFVKVRWLQALLLRFLPESGQGPSKEVQQAGKTYISNLSITSEPDVQVNVEYRGKGDPGCLHTAYLITEAALSLLLPSPQGTNLPPLAKQGGYLTPMTACGSVLVRRVQDSGGAQIDVRLLNARQGST